MKTLPFYFRLTAEAVRLYTDITPDFIAYALKLQCLHIFHILHNHKSDLEGYGILEDNNEEDDEEEDGSEDEPEVW